MRRYFGLLALFGTSLASAQTVISVYNRDTHAAFHLKRVFVESTVVGPLVKTSTWLTYDNPYKTLTEATLNFSLPETSTLGGFAYSYGDEYVQGRLMDKKKAWFIYTAITSRNRDPGIMEQWGPSTYHCQIFPIKSGSDLRIRLWTVGMLQPEDGKLTLPKAQVPKAVGYEHEDDTIAVPEWSARSVGNVKLSKDDSGYTADLGTVAGSVAQKFTDGRYYVAGMIRAAPAKHAVATTPIVHVDSAYYETVSGRNGADVSAKIVALLSTGVYVIGANNGLFGDPFPGFLKRLRVSYSVNGRHAMALAAENSTLDLLAARLTFDDSTIPKIKGLHDLKVRLVDPSTVEYFGWQTSLNSIRATVGGVTKVISPAKIIHGNDLARLWAQQMLATGQWRRSADVLRFSLKYGVPSSATALLAVPREEMERYMEKAKEFEKAEAEHRRRLLQQQRQQRDWARKHHQNWNESSGGDPEIRVVIPGANSVQAILPDRRVVELTPDGDTWGGNFEIPADAPEGKYTVRIHATMPDGSTSEQSWTYMVKRTPPTGKAQFTVVAGRLILEVRSTPGLYEVAAYAESGQRWGLKEETPGIYRCEIPTNIGSKLTVVMKDRAGNKGELTCFLPR